MAYEKLFNEIYAVASLKYLWPKYEPGFVKSESPDWINESMGFGLEVSQALLPEDGQAASFLEKYLGRPRTEIPASAGEYYGERLYFYNGRFWAILPKKDEAQDYVYKAEYRFDCKLEKLNRNYNVCRENGLYLFLHPKEKENVDARLLFDYIKQKQEKEKDKFSWVFLNCTDIIYICDIPNDTLEEIPVMESTRTFLTVETERLRHGKTWDIGCGFD